MEGNDELVLQMRRAAAADVADRERSHRRVLEASSKRLASIITTKVRTSFIGALAIFEQYFGAAWGHGLRPEQRTAEQQTAFEVWQLARQEVLNNGNNQLRAAQSEVSQYEVRWRGATSLRLPVQDSPPAA
jgi:hypothetical protein